MSDKKMVLFLSIALVIVVGLLIYGLRKDSGDFLVKETKYIHSTNNPNKCRFIFAANSAHYTISSISKSEAINIGAKICKECYDANEQNDYHEKYRKHYRELQEKKMSDLHWNDVTIWLCLDESSSKQDFDNLFVYIEKSGKLHIDGGCLDKNAVMSRVNFNNVRAFSTTCDVCVGRKFVDFIYTKVYKGYYDMSQIKDDDDETIDYDEEYYDDGFDDIYTNRQHP